MRDSKLFRFGIIGVLMALTWMALTPRGRIDQSTIPLLRDGMNVHDASEIIGLPGGCHDGYWDEHYHFHRHKAQPDIAYWITADGMILAEMPGQWKIRNARYLSRTDELSFSFISMLNDRIVNRFLHNTVGRLLQSESSWSTICLWIGAFALSMLPATFLGTYASVSRTRIWLIATVVGLVVYFAIAFSYDRLLLHHRDFIFRDACRTVCTSVLAFSMVYTCFDAAKANFVGQRFDAERGEQSKSR